NITTENSKNEDNQEEVENPPINENADEVNEEVSAEDAQQENEVSSSFEVGEAVSGTVYKIEDKFVKAHIDGSDFEGIVPISQLTSKRIERPEEIVSEDDSIEGVVIKVEDEEDRKNVILSIRKLEESNVYDSLQSAKDNDETITGTVMEVVKAGLVIDVGVRGFIPASLLSDAYIEDLEQFDGQELEVKVEDIEPEK